MPEKIRLAKALSTMLQLLCHVLLACGRAGFLRFGNDAERKANIQDRSEHTHPFQAYISHELGFSVFLVVARMFLGWGFTCLVG